MALMDGVFLDFEMVKFKCLHGWSDLREIPLRVTTQNVRLYQINMHAKYGSNSLKGEEISTIWPKCELKQTPDTRRHTPVTGQHHSKARMFGPVQNVSDSAIETCN